MKRRYGRASALVIRLLLKSRSMTVSSLGERAQIPPATMTRIMAGRSPELHRLAAISAVLEIGLAANL